MGMKAKKKTARWRKARVVECPHCGAQWAVSHGSFGSLLCSGCRRFVEKAELVLPGRPIEEGDWR